MHLTLAAEPRLTRMPTLRFLRMQSPSQSLTSISPAEVTLVFLLFYLRSAIPSCEKRPEAEATLLGLKSDGWDGASCTIRSLGITLGCLTGLSLHIPKWGRPTQLCCCLRSNCDDQERKLGVRPSKPQLLSAASDQLSLSLPHSTDTLKSHRDGTSASQQKHFKACF